MFVKRATLSRCMSLFQTVTCTSSVSDDNAFMHVLFPSPAQGCRASLLQETLSCDPAMRLTTPSPDILSLFLPSSAYILSDSILSPFPSLHYCAHTQYPYSPPRIETVSMGAARGGQVQCREKRYTLQARKN